MLHPWLCIRGDNSLDLGKAMMQIDWQIIVIMIAVFGAAVYIGKKFARQLTHEEKDPYCEHCPVDESNVQSQKKKQAFSRWTHASDSR